MKKIVSVLSVAALALSSIFAADLTIEYKTLGNIYSENNVKDDAANTSDQTRTFLDQDGYGSAQAALKIKANTDFAGFVLSFKPDATNGSGNNGVSKVDEYYGFMNFGPLQLTTGNWTSRYVNRVTEDAGKWEGADYERYKPGILPDVGKKIIGADGTKGKVKAEAFSKITQLGYAKDIDNLTLTEGGKQELSTSLALTFRPNDDTYLLFKGVAVDVTQADEGPWGGLLMDDKGNYNLKFMSGFAGEFALKINNLFDFNVVAKSLKRDHIALGAFFRPLMLGKSNMLIGFSYATSLKDQKDSVDHNQYEYGIDFRARFVVSEKLAITTMNNFSGATAEKAKGADRDYSSYKLWDMVSLAYKTNEKLTLQFTVESEAGFGLGKDLEDNSKDKDLNLCDFGGFTLSFIPGAVYKFNKNASITAGVRFIAPGVFASDDFKKANKLTSQIAIPVVFDVAL